MGSILSSVVIGLAGVMAGGIIGFGIDRLRRWEGRGLSWIGGGLAVMLGFGSTLAASWPSSPVTTPAPSVISQKDAKRNAEVLSLLQKYYPAEAGRVMARVQSAGGGEEALELALDYVTAQLFVDHGRYLNQQNAQALLAEYTQSLSYLAKVDPVLCARAAHGEFLSLREDRLLPERLRDDDFDLTRRVLVQMATHPAKPATPFTRYEAADLVLKTLKGRSREESLQLLDLWRAPVSPTDQAGAKQMCEFGRQFIAATASSPGGVRRVLAGLPT